MSIELGELGAPAPAGASLRPPRRVPARFATVLLLVAFLGVGSAPAPRPVPEMILPVAAWHQIHVDGDLVVIASREPHGGVSAELTAYRWPGGGDPLWRVSSPVWTDRMGVAWSPGTLLLSGFPGEEIATANPSPVARCRRLPGSQRIRSVPMLAR